MKTFNKIIILGGLFLTILTSCENDFLDKESGENATTTQLQTTPASGAAALSGMYTFMFDQTDVSDRDDWFGMHSIFLSLDLTGQDMVQVLHHWFGWDYLIEDRNSNYARPTNNWKYLYRLINTANGILKVSPLDSPDAEIKASAGQALAMRAYAYHYLIRIYQHTYKGHESDFGVPLYNETDLSGKDRGTVQQVYDQMVLDLQNSITALEGFSRSNKNVINKNVAQGILARVYLDMENWSGAATMASNARQGYPLMTGSQYLEGFDDVNNGEWIWGTDMTVESFPDSKYQTFVSHIATTTAGYTGIIGAYKAIDKALYDQIPSTDLRKDAYFGNLDNNKFIDNAGDFTLDLVYMRSAEMYLIEAEAKARLGSGGAQVLFNLVSTRDGGYTMSSNTGDALVEEIALQRRIELWGEGFSWFDLKRYKKGIDRSYAGSNHRADAQFVKPAEDQATFVYQIPISEFESNPNLPSGQQNN